MAEPLRRFNHWVPKSYLAAFTVTGKVGDPLVIFDRAQPSKILRIPPHAIAAERDLYVVANPESGELSDDIERFLATEIEGPFVSVRNHLAFGRLNGLSGQLTDAEEIALANFLAFQQVRTPATREKLELFMTWTGSMLAHSIFSNPDMVQRAHREMKGEEMPHEQVQSIRRALENEDIVVEPSEKAWLHFALKQVLELVPIIRELPRMVVDTPAGVVLPTSDNPLTLVRRTSSASYQHGGGWAEPQVEVVIPLSPRAALVLGGALVRFRDQGSQDWWQQVRHRIATGAHRWLYCSNEDEAARELLYGSTAPEVVLEYPGGTFRRGASAMASVLDMKRRNPGEAIVRFGPPRR